MKRRKINTRTETIEIKMLFKHKWMKRKKKTNIYNVKSNLWSRRLESTENHQQSRCTCIRILHGWINQIKSRTLTVYSENLKMKKKATNYQQQELGFKVLSSVACCCFIFSIFQELDRLADGTRRRKQQQQKQTFCVHFSMFHSTMLQNNGIHFNI